ncbi:MAG: phosphatidate cytidylyltransferase [Rhodobacteraceae bacterium]|nr:phosphatidate cytidylyltransferase [Paracoccaceae bacterium]
MSEGRWSDLTARALSAVVLLAVAGTEIWLGGLWFETFIAAVSGVMVWELVRMVDPDKRGVAVQLGLLMSAAILLSWHLPVIAMMPIALAPAFVGASMVPARRAAILGFMIWISLSGLGFIRVREGMGFDWMLWLIAVVVATDVAGYFAGKAIGGPKFWPAISPKKTWSGTAVGWVAAALVGAIAAAMLDRGIGLVLVSVLVSMASQAGDIVESALKRRVGVKDSSNLIPGHGGFLDRFDGMMGAATLVLLVGLFYNPGA